jgi:hypothetical protein
MRENGKNKSLNPFTPPWQGGDGGDFISVQIKAKSPSVPLFLRGRKVHVPLLYPFCTPFVPLLYPCAVSRDFENMGKYK